MAEFVIVVAAMAGLAGAAPAPDTATTGAAPAVPLNASTVGFRTYADLASCEHATKVLVAPAGRRLVCLPIEPLVGEMARAY